ncbi:hypothetical protein [Vreelandella stevensii]|uniref:hypothetical protein n=1 Tax=Vreelandella stevensii TaxID=502821 RepID=UPI00403AFEA4
MNSDLKKALDSMPGVKNTSISESMTSAGRLDKMLASNSPLMKRAQTQGLQQAQSRGLLNSSMAAGASQGAMIDRAQPFAMQDSNNLIQNAQRNTDAQNQRGLLQAGLIGDSYKSNQNYEQQLGLNEQAYGFESQLANQQQSFQQSNMRLQDQIQQTQMKLSQALEQGNMQLANSLQKDLNAQQDELQRGQMELGSQLNQQEAQQQQGFQQDNMRLGNQFERGLNEQQASIQAQRDERLAGFDQSMARLGAELQEAQARNDFGRTQELETQRAQIQRDRDNLIFEQQETSARNDLKREMERMGFAFELDQQNVSKAFSTNVAQSALQNVQAIQADPNLTPDAKRNAVQNAMDAANQTMLWGSKFYNTHMEWMNVPWTRG